jgi:hypothetical protein
MKRLLSALFLLSFALPVLAGETTNPLFDELIKKGIPLPEGPTVKLPAPLLKPGQVPGDVNAVLEKAAGRVPVELFLRQTATAPFSLNIKSVETRDEKRCGQLIDLSFVVYAKLDDVVETDFVEQLLAGKKKGGNGGPAPLSAKELEARGIRLLDTPRVKEQYGRVTLPLLDKVQVDGVTRSFRATYPNSVVYATRLDDRFKDDRTYPNRWRSIDKAANNGRLGPPQPYTGLGGYVVVTELPQPRGALLIEMHFLLHEPPDWFGGFNLLRSKLPIAIQDNVRSFRRKVVRD